MFSNSNNTLINDDNENSKRLPGVMDSALVYGTKDSKFKSWGNRE